MTSDFFNNGIQSSLDLKKDILSNPPLLQSMAEIAGAFTRCFESGKKVLIAGNGGSAVDAQHLVGELVCRFYYNRPALAAIALTADNAVITAAGNDFGYDSIFSRQLEALGQEGDLFLALSTSGNSTNIISAIAVAKEKGLTVVGLTGAGGGKMADLCDLMLQVPSSDTARIQEIHMLFGHLLCEWVESELFPKEK